MRLLNPTKWHAIQQDEHTFSNYLPRKLPDAESSFNRRIHRIRSLNSKRLSRTSKLFCIFLINLFVLILIKTQTSVRAVLGHQTDSEDRTAQQLRLSIVCWRSTAALTACRVITPCAAVKLPGTAQETSLLLKNSNERTS